MSIVIRGLVKEFGGRRIVDDIDLDLADGELACLLGPSGCGKTTTLRCIAGLETPDAGSIAIGGEVVFDARTGLNQPPYARNVGMVFQSYAIWPHMTVFENVAFPLRTRGHDRAGIETAVMRALDMVGLGELHGRSAQALSGGQQQRVAVARALVHTPRALLLDEPLSNLDARLRDQTRAEIRSLQRQSNIVTVYVTHDQEEALAVADRVVVMNAGCIAQAGTPDEVYNHPCDAFVAEVMGAANFLDARSCGLSSGGRLMVRSEHMHLLAYPDEVGALPSGQLRGIVTQRLFLGNRFEYHVAAEAGAIRIQSTSVVPEGTAVIVAIDLASCILVS